MARTTRPDAAERAVRHLAARQHEVVARRQLLELGLTRAWVAHRLRTEWLFELHRGVYAVGRPQLTREGRWMAGVLAYGPRAVLSHRSAGALWEIRSTASSIVDVAVGDRSARNRPGLLIHRPSTLTPADVTTRNGIPVTTPARTLVDLGTLLTARGLEDAVGEAVARHLVDPQQLHADLTAAVLRGRGAARLNATIERHDPGNARTRSKLERAFLRLCEEHNVDRPRVNAEIEGSEVDFSWPVRRLIVETDGWEFHRSATSFEADRRRDLRLRAAGWDVRRFSYRQIRDEPGRVAADLSRPGLRA